MVELAVGRCLADQQATDPTTMRGWRQDNWNGGELYKHLGWIRKVRNPSIIIGGAGSHQTIRNAGPAPMTAGCGFKDLDRSCASSTEMKSIAVWDREVLSLEAWLCCRSLMVDRKAGHTSNSDLVNLSLEYLPHRLTSCLMKWLGSLGLLVDTLFT